MESDIEIERALGAVTAALNEPQLDAARSDMPVPAE
jgi:hypothetical protein